MLIADILSADRVVSRSGLSSKKRVIEDLSSLLASGGHALREIDVFSCLINRERLGSTGLGDAVAIPHGRMPGLDDTVAAFMRLAEPVDYESSDGAPVDLVFGMLVPEDATDAHLQTLATIAEMFQRDDFRESLRTADDDAALFSLLIEFSSEDAS